jgi:hypothetical protein
MDFLQMATAVPPCTVCKECNATQQQIKAKLEKDAKLVGDEEKIDEWDAKCPKCQHGYLDHANVPQAPGPLPNQRATWLSQQLLRTNSQRIATESGIKDTLNRCWIDAE